MEQISTYDYTSSCLNNKTEYKANELITIVIDPSNCLIDTGSLELIIDI